MTSYKRKDINKTTTHKQVDGEIKKKNKINGNKHRETNRHSKTTFH